MRIRLSTFNTIQKKLAAVIFCYFLVALVSSLTFRGTGDSGDSVTHYLFAKYAFKHPELFFDHWAKPVYVLVASPFAQLGFWGIKLFNIIVSCLILLFTSLVAIRLNLKNPLIAGIILIFSPLNFVLMQSGLTEPLFALVTILSLYLILKQNYFFAATLISFLPFVRSEGLIILGIVGLSLLIKRQYKAIPFLIIGHLAYSLVGYFVHQDFLWVMNKIPYLSLSSHYGSGQLSHFVIQFLYVVGIPIYILVGLGLIHQVYLLFKRRNSVEFSVIVLGGFLAYFIAHTLFWHFGLFNSMGLKRVLIAILPLAALIALSGFNLITEQLLKSRPKIQKGICYLTLALIVLFPFTSNKAAIHWKKDLDLTIDQRCASTVATYIEKQIGLNHRFIFAHPYLSEALELDYFDPTKHIELGETALNHLKPVDVVIWENWFSVIERGVTKEKLMTNRQLIHLQDFELHENNQDCYFSIFVYRSKIIL